jgi:hypothetical protein
VAWKLPRFVHTCRSLSEFWGFIKPRFGKYVERRNYLREEFDPLLTALEAQSRSPGDENTSAVLAGFDWKEGIRFTEPCSESAFGEHTLGGMTKRAEWIQRVEAWRASGKSAREFCAGRDFSVKSLQWWGWHLRGKSGRRSKAVSFARVVQKSEKPARHDALVVQVGAVRIEVGAAVDRETLAAVLDVLLAPAGDRV